MNDFLKYLNEFLSKKAAEEIDKIHREIKTFTQKQDVSFREKSDANRQAIDGLLNSLKIKK